MTYFCVRCGRRLVPSMPQIGRRDPRIGRWLAQTWAPKRAMCEACIAKVDNE